jgi:hypothetical protein
MLPSMARWHTCIGRCVWYSANSVAYEGRIYFLILHKQHRTDEEFGASRSKTSWWYEFLTRVDGMAEPQVIGCANARIRLNES